VDGLHGYARVLKTCVPYLVIPEAYRKTLSLRPFGVAIPRRNVFSPHDLRSAPFLHLLQRLDDLTYGPRGMKMPRWALYDCAEMVGGLFGFGRPARSLPPWVREALSLEEGYAGLVPLSLMILIPMRQPGAYLCYALSSVNQVAPGAAPAGLRLLTEALALQVFPVRTLYATTQWRSATLGIHARFGPLELLTAYTPAHTLPATLTFRLEVTSARLRAALRGRGRAVRAEAVDADDERALRRLQREIEAGRRAAVVGPPRVEGATTWVPVAPPGRRGAR
jgi:hypothetical protein